MDSEEMQKKIADLQERTRYRPICEDRWDQDWRELHGSPIHIGTPPSAASAEGRLMAMFLSPASEFEAMGLRCCYCGRPVDGTLWMGVLVEDIKIDFDMELLTKLQRDTAGIYANEPHALALFEASENPLQSMEMHSDGLLSKDGVIS